MGCSGPGGVPVFTILATLGTSGEGVTLFLGHFRAAPQHMEVPTLGVQLDLQLPGYTTATATRDLSHVCDLHHSSPQRQILNPRSKARDGTCVLMDDRFISVSQDGNMCVYVCDICKYIYIYIYTHTHIYIHIQWNITQP